MGLRGGDQKVLRWSRIQLSNIWPDSFWLASSVPIPEERRSYCRHYDKHLRNGQAVRVRRVLRAHLEWSEIPTAVFYADFFSQPGTRAAKCRTANFGGGTLTPKDLTASTHGVRPTSVKS